MDQGAGIGDHLQLGGTARSALCSLPKFGSEGPLVIPDLDYSRLRRSLAYLVEQYSGEIAPNEPAKPLEQENRRESDQSVLVRAIAEFVEGSQDFCAER